MNESKWECPKCGNTNHEVDKVRTTGGNFLKLFNIQNKKFTTITCSKCKYTEFYKGDTSTLMNIIDLFTN